MLIDEQSLVGVHPFQPTEGDLHPEVRLRLEQFQPGVRVWSANENHIRTLKILHVHVPCILHLDRTAVVLRPGGYTDSDRQVRCAGVVRKPVNSVVALAPRGIGVEPGNFFSGSPEM
jgi:hypothetical protein